MNMADVTCVAAVCRVTACNLCWLQVSPLVRAGNTPQGKNTPHTRNTPQGDPCCPHKTPLWCVKDNCKCETKELERRCTRGLAREETCEPGSKGEDGAGDVTAGDYQCLETVRSRIELHVFTLQQQDIKTSRISSAVTGMCQCEGHK